MRHVPAPRAFIISADWLVCDSRNEISPGELRVMDGAISQVGRGLRAAFPHDPVVRLPRCALIPGLVNAHTHVELTRLRGAIRAGSFAKWLSEVTTAIGEKDAGFFAQGAAVGAAELASAGVTSVGDHSTFGMSHAALRDAGLQAVVFKEAFCPNPDADVGAVVNELAAEIVRMEAQAGPHVQIGMSCHAPYNAPQAFVEEAVKRLPDVPRSIHVSESQDEVTYIQQATGDIAARHKERGFVVRAHKMSPVEYLDNCSFWNRGALAVHLTAATRGDLAVLKNRGVSCIFCPSSNAALGVGTPPIAAALEMGLECGLGTDSAISNPVQDLFEEMRFAVLSSRLRHQNVSDEQVFDVATIGGARALGLTGRGVLREGLRADIVAVRLGRDSGSSQALSRVVWEATSGDVQAVWAAGEVVYSRGEEL